MEEVGISLGDIGIAASFVLASIGAAIGMIANGPTVIGAWKKCYMQKRPAPFILLVFAATCLTNVIYGFLTMTMINRGLSDSMLLALGVGTGLCIAIVAYTQAKCAAAAADAYAETGQGLGNYLMVIGIAETIGLFAMVFTLIQAP
ncbi:MAG: V-type ATP synthase subunit K [Treponema sp.]|jgi:V/A-type H+-transporting ATPase subunit K|nr:V-type ATP synthase subunit K [Treponema sp.]